MSWTETVMGDLTFGRIQTDTPLSAGRVFEVRKSSVRFAAARESS